jgi:hypothetical protein
MQVKSLEHGVGGAAKAASRRLGSWAMQPPEVHSHIQLAIANVSLSILSLYIFQPYPQHSGSFFTKYPILPSSP